MNSSAFLLIFALSLVSVCNAVSLNLPLLMNQTVTNVVCPDHRSCADHNTCCEVSPGKYGCCRYSDAVCCPDKLTCCPHGMICADSTGKEAASPLTEALNGKENTSEKTKSVLSLKVDSNANDVCPGGQYECPGMHCCATASGVWMCCPSGRTCCGGGYFCCASGSTATDDEDDAKLNTAIKFLQEVLSHRKNKL